MFEVWLTEQVEVGKEADIILGDEMLISDGKTTKMTPFAGILLLSVTEIV